MARVFLHDFFRLHRLPRTIVSDRGNSFVSIFWNWICRLLGISRHLSTAHHPESDGVTERLNAVIEDYLRHFVNIHQSDWASLLPCCELALDNRPSSAIGDVSPFFLSHGYHFEISPPTKLSYPETSPKSPIQKGSAIVKKLTDASKLAQASLAFSRKRQEFYERPQHTEWATKSGLISASFAL